MIKKYFLAISLLTTTFLSLAQTITYQVNLDNITHHELFISVHFTDLSMDTLTLVMPDASPGRYASHSFAKNVYEEVAVGDDGEELELIRSSPITWEIPLEGKKEVKVTYTLYANHGDGTYSGVDSRKLHLNMPATFLYGEELEDRPISLQFDLSEYPEWSVATQLPQKSTSTFSAPNYYYFFDSPTFVGKIARRSWQLEGQTIEIAMMHEGSEKELDDYTDWVKKVVETQRLVFGELPTFDFGKYTFLAAYNPYVFGDGMEHRNSTICSSRSSLATNASGLIGTISHEFFHAWNVERIRPASLEPFDFSQINMSEALWFAEGFTSYYDDLVLCRAGIITPEKYIEGLASGLNYVINSPARNMRSPIEMSHNAPFVDAANANDETNYLNNFVSYYSYGAVLGLMLDLSIRKEFKNLTLDDFMQNVWLAYGKTEIPYTIPDLQQVLTKTTGDAAFAQRFFEESIYDGHLPDFQELLSPMGVYLTSVDETEVYFGRTGIDKKGKLLTAVKRGTGWYEAGVEKGDTNITLDGKNITDQETFRQVKKTLEIGKSYEVTFEQLGVWRSGRFTATQDPVMKTQLVEKSKKKEIKNRSAWLWID